MTAISATTATPVPTLFAGSFETLPSPSSSPVLPRDNPTRAKNPIHPSFPDHPNPQLPRPGRTLGTDHSRTCLSPVVLLLAFHASGIKRKYYRVKSAFPHLEKLSKRPSTVPTRMQVAHYTHIAQWRAPKIANPSYWRTLGTDPTMMTPSAPHRIASSVGVTSQRRPSARYTHTLCMR